MRNSPSICDPGALRLVLRALVSDSELTPRTALQARLGSLVRQRVLHPALLIGVGLIFGG